MKESTPKNPILVKLVMPLQPFLKTLALFFYPRIVVFNVFSYVPSAMNGILYLKHMMS